MDLDNIFRLDLSLQKIAKISIVLIFWEKKGVRQKIGRSTNSIQDLDDDLEQPYIHGKACSFQKVIDCIFEQLNFLNLPEKLSDEIKALTITIGEKIYYWRQYVLRALRISSKWADKIYWTSHGDIDESKIIQDFWLKDLEFPNCYCSTENEEKYCYHLPGIFSPEKRARNYKRFQTAKNKIFSDDQTEEAVISTWIWFSLTISSQSWRDNLFSFRIPKKFNEFKTTFFQLPATDVLSACLELYFEFGVKYIWNRLTTCEKHFMAVKCANKCLDDIKKLCYDDDEFGHGKTTNYWDKEKVSKMLLFFINEMTEIQRSEFLEKGFLSVYKVMAGIWPYQELCLKILNAFPNCVSKHHLRLLKLNINWLISGSRTHRKRTHVTNQIFYQRMLLILFDLVPKPLILNCFIGDNFKIIKKVMRKFNYSTFNFVWNNFDLKDYKNEILEIGMHDFKQLLCRGRFTVFDEFIQNLKLSDSELKLLKRKFDLLTNFLTVGDFESADKYLNWRYDTEHEKNQIKNQVDAVQLCSAFVLSDNFETANNFLIWRFDTEDERKEIKEALNLTGTTSVTDFIRNKIFDFKTPEKCNELLKWFFESEEDITQFRKTKIIRDEFFFEKCWDSKMRYSSLDEFLLKVCLMSSGEIQNFKSKAANKINWYMDTFALGKCKFEMLDDLLDWICEDKDEKRDIIRNYMNSPRGCLLCIKIFNEREYPDTFSFFNNYWIESSFDYSELLTSLNKSDKNCSVSGRTLASVRFLLQKIQKGCDMNAMFCCVKYTKPGDTSKSYYICSSDEDEDISDL